LVSLNSKWITKTLETLAKDQQGIRISITLNFNRIQFETGIPDFVTNSTVDEEWKVLDELLVRRWVSNSIPTVFARTCYNVRGNAKLEKEWMKRLLPVALNKGAVCLYRREALE
jgi:hypothetical protein